MNGTLVLVDANFLIAWLGNKKTLDLKQRAQRFVNRLVAMRSSIVIPAPAIAEYLVQAKVPDLIAINAIIEKPWVIVGAFDYMSAVELHLLDCAARSLGDKRDGVDAPWQKIKVDRQIIAIGRAHQCDLVVSNDHSVMAGATRAGISTCSLEERDSLEMPTERRRPARAPHTGSRGCRSVREPYGSAELT